MIRGPSVWDGVNHWLNIPSGCPVCGYPWMQDPAARTVDEAYRKKFVSIVKGYPRKDNP